MSDLVLSYDNYKGENLIKEEYDQKLNKEAMKSCLKSLIFGCSIWTAGIIATNSTGNIFYAYSSQILTFVAVVYFMVTAFENARRYSIEYSKQMLAKEISDTKNIMIFRKIKTDLLTGMNCNKVKVMSLNGGYMIGNVEFDNKLSDDKIDINIEHNRVRCNTKTFMSLDVM